MPVRHPSRIVIALVSIALLAGCAGGPGESTAPPDCGPYETLHYEEAPGREELRAAFERAGYAWDARSDRIADVTGPAGGSLVVSHEPGVSGDALVISATGQDAHRLAVAAAAIVNFTAEDARLDRWLAGNNCLDGPMVGREI
jgi:hypothetical protein